MPSRLEQTEHDESLRALVALENLAIEVASDTTSGLPKDPDEASDELRTRLSDAFVDVRRAARVQGANRSNAEYEIVRRIAIRNGYTSSPLSRIAIPIRSDVDEAGKWADDIAKLVRKRATESEIRSAIARSKGRLSASARAIVDDAWSDQRDRILRETARVQKEANAVPFVGTIWDARMDKAMCPRCHELDGTIRPIGMKFPDGAIPGKVHVSCRCNGGLVFAPVIASISDAA